MLKNNYGGASVPKKEKVSSSTANTSQSKKMKELEEEIASLRDELTKKNRDNLDSMNNLTIDNFDSDVQAILNQSVGVIKAKDLEEDEEGLYEFKKDGIYYNGVKIVSIGG